MKTLLVTGGIGSGKSVVCRMLERRGIPVYDFDVRTKALYDTDKDLLGRIVEVMRPYFGKGIAGRSYAQDGGKGECECGEVASEGLIGENGLVGNQSGLIGEKGLLERGVLASLIFNDPRALAELEAVVHPAVLRDFEKWKDDAGKIMMCAEGNTADWEELSGAAGNFGISRIIAAESAIALEKPLFRDAFDAVILVDAPAELRLRRVAQRDGMPKEAVEKRMGAQALTSGVGKGVALYVLVNDGDEASLETKLDEILSDIYTKIENRNKNEF